MVARVAPNGWDWYRKKKKTIRVLIYRRMKMNRFCGRKFCHEARNLAIRLHALRFVRSGRPSLARAHASVCRYARAFTMIYARSWKFRWDVIRKNWEF